MFRPSRTNLIMLLAAAYVATACGIGNNETEESPLPDVDAMDDQVVTFMNTPINIRVLDNDEQDDDLLTDVGIAVDQNMNEQPGAAEIDAFSFPERVIYTPPIDFLGPVTFTYDITGLGAQFDFTSTDTATVTVTVSDVRPPVTAVDDMRTIDQDDDPIRIFVLRNDMQDAGEIDMFDIDARDDMGNLQLGAVESAFQGRALLYTPPPGFSGFVSFSYIILGAGIQFELNSVASATVTVEVVPTPEVAIVQFEDASMQQFEIQTIFVGQDAIDSNIPTAQLFEPGIIPHCFELDPGTDLPLRARLLVEGEDGLEELVVDGICPELAVGVEYTIRVQPDDPLDIVCVEGLAEPSFCF